MCGHVHFTSPMDIQLIRCPNRSVDVNRPVGFSYNCIQACDPYIKEHRNFGARKASCIEET
ncbi:hypothetical protein PHET_11849 [Paragonimus heterotremus]|uniref:Uncharacterized protein n=1 Tax=Paragonimus heterotremus TaxID=100268 RepID=A0A8J4WCE4_9TREM|nr:hypothetical protein PHET_11849 [Paragonimus heterotremus]